MGRVDGLDRTDRHASAAFRTMPKYDGSIRWGGANHPRLVRTVPLNSPRQDIAVVEFSQCDTAKGVHRVKILGVRPPGADTVVIGMHTGECAGAQGDEAGRTAQILQLDQGILICAVTVCDGEDGF